MKTRLLFLVFALSCAFVNAQSTFAFNNRFVNAPVFDSLGQPLAGPDFMAELYGNVTSDSLTPTTQFFSHLRVQLPFATESNAGYVVLNNAIMTVWNAPAGGWAWLQLRAWDARLGATYEDVEALGIGGYGESPLFYANGGDPTAFPADAPAPLIGLQSFSLRPVVPEPSALALVGLGGLSLWLRRRSIKRSLRWL